MTERAIFWFRRDLSLDDNLAWAIATCDHDEVVPLYVLDRRLLSRASPLRRRLLLACIAELDAQLRVRGGRLTVIEGCPDQVLPRLAEEVDATAVLWNSDVTRFARRRDAKVTDVLRRSGVDVGTAYSTLVHPPGSIVTAAGSVPRVFSRFYEKWASNACAAAHEPGDADILDLPRDRLPEFERELPFPVGPDAAERRVAQFARIVDGYATSRDRPDVDATSHLSVDLKFGTVSPRTVLRALDGPGPGRRAFVRQLAWRDWYAHLFDERPELVDRPQQRVYERIAWRNDPADIDAWQQGRTGYPIVDAAMRELSATGWMHNRLRLIAASFLVKDLLVDWRIGERHFRRLLIDGDVPQNAGNWQWCAGTGPDAAPYFRILNPVTQGRRFDPRGAYVRRWVTELARVDDGAIHAPWEMRPLELAAAGVTLGESYPRPVVDHRLARQRAVSAYAAARAGD